MTDKNIAQLKTYKYNTAKVCYNNNGLEKLLEQPSQAYPQFNLSERSKMATAIVPVKKHANKLKGLEQEVVAAYQSGLSLNQVARIFNVCGASVCLLLKRLYVPARSLSEGTMLACTPEKNKNQSQRMQGKPSRAAGKKWKLSHIKRCPTTAGENNTSWKGGVTPLHRKIRTSPEYGAWRMAVYRRDNWTCVFCGVKGTGAKARRGEVVLHADHIKPFAEYPELRFDVNNGRTLCATCHRQTETWGGRTKFQKKVA